MTLAKNIRHLRKLNEWSQEYLADKLGYKSYTTIQKWEMGTSEPPLKVLQKLAEIFRVDMDDLANQDLEAAPEKRTPKPHTSVSKGVSVPILSTVAAGMPVDAYEDILGYEEIDRKLARTGTFFALKIKGDSMLPVLQEGDVVIVRQQPDVESGDIAIVLINGNTATVKKVQKQGGGITLVAFNMSVYAPHFYTNNEIESLPIIIAGKVVEMKRMF